MHLVADGSELSLDIIEDPLIEAINQAGVGEFDGNEFGPDDAVLYMYGPSADELFSIADPVLQSLRLPTGSFVVKRYGPPGAEEVRIGLG
ncbi:MAG: hypothetical protein AAGA65_31475 [Actinomycetota bacterium]